jgi:hypothetical protein
MLEQAGLTISVKQYWIYSAASMIACVMIAKITGQVPFVLGHGRSHRPVRRAAFCFEISYKAAPEKIPVGIRRCAGSDYPPAEGRYAGF